MSLPSELQAKIESILEKIPLKKMKEVSRKITENYEKQQTSASIFSKDLETATYLAVRFPATFAAVEFVLKELQKKGAKPKTLLDLGSGPAVATLAAKSVFHTIESAILFEREKKAIDLGTKLLDDLKSNWHHIDLSKISQFPKADLSIFSYSLSEIEKIEPLLENAFESTSTLVLIEPGTPFGYQKIIQARNFLLQKGAHILAPCPHEKQCPLQSNNWCHFSVRLNRSKWHQQVKGAFKGFEDEKLSYLIVSKEAIPIENSRILRPPKKGTGHVVLDLCTKEGKEEVKTVTKKDKEEYKQARKASWGDEF